MKFVILFMIVSLPLPSSAAQAAANGINCQLIGSRTWIHVVKSENEKPEVTLLHYNSTELKDIVIGTFANTDVQSASFNEFGMNFSAKKGNDVLKVSSDFDLFGGDRDGKVITWRGFLFRSNSSSQGEVQKISCSYDLDSQQ